MTRISRPEVFRHFSFEIKISLYKPALMHFHTHFRIIMSRVYKIFIQSHFESMQTLNQSVVIKNM